VWRHTGGHGGNPCTCRGAVRRLARVRPPSRTGGFLAWCAPPEAGAGPGLRRFVRPQLTAHHACDGRTLTALPEAGDPPNVETLSMERLAAPARPPARGRKFMIQMRSAREY